MRKRSPSSACFRTRQADEPVDGLAKVKAHRDETGLVKRKAVRRGVLTEYRRDTVVISFVEPSGFWTPRLEIVSRNKFLQHLR